MVDDLVQFLRDRIADDQRIAAAARGQGEGRWRHETGYHSGRVEDERGETVVYDEGAPLEEEAAHIARHDPARVLRDTEARRGILDTLQEEGGDRMFADIFRLLALSYTDHPDYDEAWRPE